MLKHWLRCIDLLFIMFLILLLAAGLFILSSASFNVDSGDPNHYVKLQAVWIVTGILIAVLVASIDYRKYSRFTWWLYGINIIFLLSVILFGQSALGATRWIKITSSITIQPSEFAKILIIVTLADFLAKRQGKLNRYRNFIAPFFFVLVPMILVYKQPDLGTTLVFMAIFICMMFMAGANPWKLGSLLLGGAFIIGIALWLHFSTNLPSWLHFAQGMPLPMQDYQLQRLTVFINPSSDTAGTGYNILQSIWAIGSGGLWGKGYRMGTQTHLNFLPERQTDFIFAVVGEEFGFIGAITLLFLFYIFISRALYIIKNTTEPYGFLIGSGIVSMLTFHILVNVGMSSGIMPVTGIPLPFISYGGSTLWSIMLAVGLLISINKINNPSIFR
ncbi:rod shape-determining protein RodA [Desulfosporosinus sp. SB140]|uniref:rod shape-determining protein RodA n=1 Tax=Desulfosporosinus paludis TaxID=3115649 RepID=UPI003890AE4E